MFRAMWTEPCPIQGVIRGRIPCGLGPYTDADGKQWDVAGYGKDERIGWWVWATDLIHPYYRDTSGFQNWGLVSQRWEPYELDVVDDERS